VSTVFFGPPPKRLLAALDTPQDAAANRSLRRSHHRDNRCFQFCGEGLPRWPTVNMVCELSQETLGGPAPQQPGVR
jgi:hypothetical protein